MICASKENKAGTGSNVTYQADPLVPFDSALGLCMRHWLGLTSWSLGQVV